MSNKTVKKKTRTNKNIINLYITNEDKKQFKKSRPIEISDSEDSDFSDNEQEFECKPKNIINKLVKEDTKIVSQEDTLIPKMFTYEDADVLVIQTKDKEYWYKAKDIAILLEYKNTADAITRHINNKYKKSYADIGT
ncbi:putative BRO-N domain-containing protein [Cotonvirus japonicus]|uniref:BRO-N domain-containing protein n=1 Tax=Cotonvirus japonicus TaxID=2811091 RepID=A0ABM7NUH6_9VIRU|nr:putative BRO-N domain-containing protein [Cotonvirus japonicus]BCS83789.1 putative BRO-N domain-containing protein [Cotonvirus japonicus]